MMFGPFLGALAGAVLSFLIARTLGREVIERLFSRSLAFYPRGGESVLAKIVFFSLLLPVVSFDIVSYGAGPAIRSADEISGTRRRA